jgi:hypothetical protein
MAGGSPPRQHLQRPLKTAKTKVPDETSKNAKFRTPPHKLKTVALETGREEGGVNDFQQGKTMKVPVWDFKTIVKSFLLDPILFGNPDNLVNSNATFEKFIVDDPMESKEYLASRHYSQSYDLCIDDVDGSPRQTALFPI